MCVTDRGWLTAEEFEDAIAVTNMLPGPASTQLAIWCAWRLRGRAGALVGAACFITPGLALIIVLAAVFLQANPPQWLLGAAAGAGAAVPLVAVNAALSLAPASWKRSAGTPPSGPPSAPSAPSAAAGSWRAADRARAARWVLYAAAGAIAAALAGSWLVVVLVSCGLVELAVRRAGDGRLPALTATVRSAPVVAAGGLGALAWVAFKVGALSFGGGFVIIPLMQHDAVSTYHWMTGPQFLNAVALGQVTPGPVVQTVAVVGYAAAGVGGAVLAATIAFAPSVGMIVGGGGRFDRVRRHPGAAAFLAGAGPSAIGAIAGAAVPLGAALHEWWQLAVAAAAATWLLVGRRSVVVALIGAGAVGVVAALAGAPLPR